MNRDELERKIVEASEGELTLNELADLEKELTNWPELKRDYTAIRNLPDLNRAYPVADKKQFSSQIDAVLLKVHEQNRGKEEFTELSLHIFKKYALAASILIIAGSSAMFLSDNSAAVMQETPMGQELFAYQNEAAASDNYMMQIDNLLLGENDDEY